MDVSITELSAILWTPDLRTFLSRAHCGIDSCGYERNISVGDNDQAGGDFGSTPLRVSLRSIDGFRQALEDCAATLATEGNAHLHRIRQASQYMAQFIWIRK